MMARHPIYQLQPLITNQLPQGIEDSTVVVAIIGSNPSTTALSPAVWNRVFASLGMDCVYVSLDVPDALRLSDTAALLRQTHNVAGFNVTMPYKADVMALLDDVDHRARAVGAVNTVIRDWDGTLRGFNTDGEGALLNVCAPAPGRQEALLDSLHGKTVLLLGAGGAARAAAVFLAEALNEGRLCLANRTEARAQDLAQRVAAISKRVEVITLLSGNVDQVAAEVDLVYNLTTVGQGGVLRQDSGHLLLEPFSPLAPADIEPLTWASGESETSFRTRFTTRYQSAILANLKRSYEILAALPESAAIADAIHTPAETALLTQARQLGRRGVNGRGMNLGQALDAFCDKIMAPYLDQRGWRTSEKREEIRRLMQGQS